MRADQLGLIEYLLVIGPLLVLAVFELVATLRIQRQDRRMRNGSKARTQGD